MKTLLLTISLLAACASPLAAQTNYDSAGRDGVIRRPPVIVETVPREVVDRLAIGTIPLDPRIPASISVYTVCTTLSTETPDGQTIDWETCDPVIVWCPNENESCVTIN